MTNSNRTWRTDDDARRTQRAADVVARQQSAVDAARRDVQAVEATCIASPDDKSFARASAARRVLEDAERALALAKAHEAIVESEIAAAEHARISDEIARLEAVHGDVDVHDGERARDLADDEARMMAAEVGVLLAALDARIRERSDQQSARRDELNDLRARIGRPTQARPSDGRGAAWTSLMRIAWAASGLDGRANPLTLLFLHTSLGTVTQELGAELDALRARVAARRAGAPSTKSTAAGVAVAAATAVGLLLSLGAVVTG